MSAATLTKGEKTREQLVGSAAALFNQRGYEATSLSEVMSATGLTKGGIYRHFESKQELSLAAFRYATDQMRERFAKALVGVKGARARLLTIIAVYAEIPSNPPVAGGCPILNAAVESDDGDPELRDAARKVMDELQSAVQSLIRAGKCEGEFGPSTDPVSSAQVLLAQLEGAVMLSKLYGTDAPMRATKRHLETWLSQLGSAIHRPEARRPALGHSRGLTKKPRGRRI